MTHNNILNECNCECHFNDNIVHCVPCCYECRYCNRTIFSFHIYDHEKECKKNQKMNNPGDDNG